jgi:serine/threonine-protein kinase RsbW
MVDLEYNKRIAIPSDLEGLRECLELTKDIQRIFQLDTDKIFAFQTVLLEAVNNAIIHGNKFNKDLLTIVTVSINRELIFIEVEDQGDGFDLDLVPSPVNGSNILLENGRGIFFIRQLSDGFKTIGKGNIVNIIINR